jgi:hypothetical protein
VADSAATPASERTSDAFKIASFQLHLCEAVALNSGAGTSDTVVFNFYTPRADAHRHGYDAWLRTVDVPFQAGLPGMVNNSSWRIVDSPLGLDNWTDFDIQYVDGLAAAAAHRSNRAMRRFGRDWIERWGANPSGPPHENFRKCVLRRVSSAT